MLVPSGGRPGTGAPASPRFRCYSKKSPLRSRPISAKPNLAIALTRLPDGGDIGKYGVRC